MNNNYYHEPVVEPIIQTKTSVAFAKSYLWMLLASLITLFSGLFFSYLLQTYFANMSIGGLSIYLVLFIASFVIQMILCVSINKTSLVEANFSKSFVRLIIFSLLSGFTFSNLFAFFDVVVLYQVFGGVCVYFFILSLLTYLFRKKIHKAASFAYIGLITLLISSIIVSIYSIFAFNGTNVLALHLVISIIGIIVFTIITMVDIKTMYNIVENSYNKNSASVAAAFCLYLDFINIFTYILRILLILGKNRSRN